MDKVTVRLLLLSLTSLAFGEGRGEWKSVSKDNRAIEFRWSRPANNSCEVYFRDSQLRSKTTLSTIVEYLPHKGAKRTSEKEKGQVVLSVSSLASEHLIGCEEIVTVIVTGVERE